MPDLLVGGALDDASGAGFIYHAEDPLSADCLHLLTPETNDTDDGS